MRAALGAAVGALLVLLSRQETRTPLLAALAPRSPNALESLLASPKLVRPTDLDSAAAYLHAGSDRLAEGRALTSEERRTLLDLASEGGVREPDNPFWSLAAAVFERNDPVAPRGGYSPATTRGG